LAPQPGEFLYLIDLFLKHVFFCLLGGKKGIMKIHEDSYAFRCVLGQVREVVNYWMTSFGAKKNTNPKEKLTNLSLGGGFKYFFMFIPSWGRIPF